MPCTPGTSADLGFPAFSLPAPQHTGVLVLKAVVGNLSKNNRVCGGNLSHMQPHHRGRGTGHHACSVFSRWVSTPVRVHPGNMGLNA